MQVICIVCNTGSILGYWAKSAYPTHIQASRKKPKIQDTCKYAALPPVLLETYTPIPGIHAGIPPYARRILPGGIDCTISGGSYFVIIRQSGCTF